MDLYIPWDGWRLVRQLGQGSLGTVYEIRKETNGTVEKAAMKVISVPENNEVLDELYGSGYDDASVEAWCSERIGSIVKEYNMLILLKGKANIVSCEDFAVIPHKNDPGADIYIRMEMLTSLTKILSLVSKPEYTLYAQDRETLHRLRPHHSEFTEEDVIKLGKDILQALEICEKYQIVHRNIKPENIFISDDGDYKLGEFDITRSLERTASAPVIVFGRYMAPELIKGDMYGHDVDTYSLGLVMYRLLNRGRLPFYPLNGFASAMEIETAQRRRLAGEHFDPPVDGSPELKAIVMKACSYEHKDRFASAYEMAKKLAEAEEIRMERMRNRIPDPIIY